MFGYQAHSRRRANNTTNSVPTEAQRTGDFSALLALGSQYQIYDPFSTKPSGSLSRRDSVAGNITPLSRIDPITLKVINYYPLPNTAGTADFLNNYSRTRQDRQDLSQPVVRVDHNFSERHRMFARYSHSDFDGHFDEFIPNSPVRGRTRLRPHRGIALDNVFVISPQMVFDVRYGFTWFKEDHFYDNAGWDLTEFGFPKSLLGQSNPAGIAFPQINTTGLLQLGNDGGWSDVNDSRAEFTPFYGFFVQDDWRISTRLTVNLGLRWEYEGPIRERYNRTTRQFDFETANPIQSEAQANYAKASIPEIPTSQFRTLGVVTFACIDGNPRTVMDSYYKAIMPRVGFAFQLTPRTVLRGG